MTPTEFRRIRKKLGLTQAELSALLGYGNAVRVSEFERATNPVPVPRLLAVVMEALDGGFWPHDWPR